jgi:hypothetical protein
VVLRANTTRVADLGSVRCVQLRSPHAQGLRADESRDVGSQPQLGTVHEKSGGGGGASMSASAVKQVLHTVQRWVKKPTTPRPRQGTTRAQRPRATSSSRRGPPSLADPDEPEPPPARSLTRAERAHLKAQVDAAVRQGLLDQAVRDQALFKAVAAWGEAEVVR